MLDDRKKRILQAIIEEYIGTAEPVSSASIIQNYDINFSSATIRNEMSDLEKIFFPFYEENLNMVKSNIYNNKVRVFNNIETFFHKKNKSQYLCGLAGLMFPWFKNIM